MPEAAAVLRPWLGNMTIADHLEQEIMPFFWCSGINWKKEMNRRNG